MVVVVSCERTVLGSELVEAWRAKTETGLRPALEILEAPAREEMTDLESMAGCVWWSRWNQRNVLQRPWRREREGFLVVRAKRLQFLGRWLVGAR